MSKLKEKRLEAVRRMMRNHGIEFGNHIFMSLWEVAGNLNNCWHAADFISKAKQAKYGKFSHGRFVVHDWNLAQLFPAIRHAVRGSDIELRSSYNNRTEYLLMKSESE